MRQTPPICSMCRRIYGTGFAQWVFDVWDRPICSIGCRVKLTSVKCIGAGLFTRQLICYMGEGQNLKWYDLVYDNRELSNEQFAILVAVCRWEPNGNVKLMAGFGQAQILIVYRANNAPFN